MHLPQPDGVSTLIAPSRTLSQEHTLSPASCEITMGVKGSEDAMTSISLQEAQANLPELIHKMTPGDQVVITENSQPVAQLTVVPSAKPQPLPGRCQGMLTVLAEDDEHLADFVEYMP